MCFESIDTGFQLCGSYVHSRAKDWDSFPDAQLQRAMQTFVHIKGKGELRAKARTHETVKVVQRVPHNHNWFLSTVSDLQRADC